MKFLLLAFISVVSSPVFARIDQPLLYQISSPDGGGPVSYLFGTIHFGVGSEEIPEYVVEIFRQVPTHAYELTSGLTFRAFQLFRENSQEAMNRLLDLQGHPIEAPGDFNPAEVDLLVQLGIPRTVAERMKDHQCDLLYYRKQLFGDEKLSMMDGEMLSESKRMGKELIALENDDIRKEMELKAGEEPDFCSIRQIGFSPSFVDDKETAEKYRLKSPATLTFQRKLSTELRNKKWMETLGPRLKTNSVFVTVGAAHLPNPDGLIELLRGFGFDVVPLNSSK